MYTHFLNIPSGIWLVSVVTSVGDHRVVVVVDLAVVVVSVVGVKVVGDVVVDFGVVAVGLGVDVVVSLGVLSIVGWGRLVI